jgi:branched-chain amino acid transport system substrate-binding protein
MGGRERSECPERNVMRKLLPLAFAALIATASAAHAQLKIGISGPLEGKNAGSMLELVKGAEMYVNSINLAGGVGGQKIQIVARDDNFEVPKTVNVVKALIEQDNVLALMLVRGTPHNEAILPLLAQHKIALVGPSTGAMVFHKPVNPYVFNVRTAYQLEAEKLVALLKTSGMHKIAVLHVDDGFGKDVVTGLKSGFIESNLQPAVILSFDRVAAAKDSTDFMKPILTELLKSDPQIVVVVGAGLAVKNAVFAIRAAGSQAKIATLSNNASTAFIKLLDQHSRGVIVSQVFPDEKSLTNAFVREAQIMAFKNKVTLTPGMMEGFAAAKVVVKALRDAGPSPSRASVQRALQNMDKFDMGDITIRYSANDHTGLDITDLSIITKDKAFLR